MAARKGQPKVGGRKKGSKNKLTAAKEAAIAATGQTPLEFMLSMMRSDSQPENIRLDAAKSAAPYVHPRLSAIEHTGKDGKDLIPKVHEIIIEHHAAAEEDSPTLDDPTGEDRGGEAPPGIPSGPVAGVA